MTSTPLALLVSLAPKLLIVQSMICLLGDTNTLVIGRICAYILAVEPTMAPKSR
jgi:hypothetical protein